MTRTAATAAAEPLLERSAELGAVTAVLAAAAAGRGGALVIEGPAGIGKTSLLDATRVRAEELGFRVLLARASPLEREYGFGVVRDLLEPVLRAAGPEERAVLLDGAAALAGRVLEPVETAPSPTFAALHGIYWLLAGLAERRALLVAVDDGHWADVPSLRALHHVAHRIADLPVLLLVTRRPGEPGGEAGELLDALAADVAATLVRPAPLSAAATATVVARVFGGPVAPAFAAACHEVCAGNPLLLGTLARSLRQAGVAPDEASTGAVHDRAPAIVAAFVLPRLRHLPRPAGAVARALSVLGPGAELRHLAAVAGLAPAVVTEAIDRLAAAELVVPGPPPAFPHPLLGQVVAERMPAAERHAAHRTAAAELAADGAPAQAVAAHLLAIPPLRDDWVVERLRDAARDALAQGAPRSAVSHLTRALAEPPSPDVRPAVLFELGAAETHLGPAAGLDRLQAALRVTTGATDRARVALRLARGLETAWELPRALAVLQRAVAETDAAPDVDPEVRLLLEAEYVGLARSRPETRADALGRLARLLPEAGPDSVAGCILLASSAAELVQEPGRAAEAVARARAALLGIGRTADGSFVTGVLYLAAPVLAAAGEIDAAFRAADAAVTEARARGALVELGAALGSRAEMGRRLGALLDAESDVRLSQDLAREAGVGAPEPLLLGSLLPVLVECGRTAAAQQELDRLGRPGPSAHVNLLAALGRLRLAQGRPAEALEALLAAGARLATRGWRHPGLLPWQTDAALAAHALGRHDQAGELAGEALRTARRHGADVALGIALRTTAQLAGDPAGLAEAAQVLAATPARLEHARALVELGAALRRSNRRADARGPLRQGQDLAARCGAGALVAQAGEELAATGARPRTVRCTGPEALSVSERRVARLAAEGLANRDIAQALFVTVKTVEVHLSACYRKLGITSRAELPGVLG
ncbi:helix-turn-helix transcriptional regulator [Geodermatophilus marinus]|uniref:helix-turn-helix transcriptional regulator n=1 Tax=Geodermatophilus sp. LHW52908 TaxID=2303986 RepID=UPI000E3E25D1|nr:AAA family ATPase [Geodermatophilus sp. LHW52908]RFU22362.1 LuxR family transcriptional regulator [Geodermatophilus sp. LHW52908]